MGKFLRMGFLFIFILGIFEYIPSLAGYSKAEAVLFFAFFNLIDLLVQIFFFRGFWFLQEYVRTGEFDKILTYPVSAKFLVAFKITDWMDVVTLLPTPLLFIYSISGSGINISFIRIISVIFFIFAALLTAYGFCLFLSAITFYTTNMGNVWWLLRDTAAMARFPLSIFPTIFAGIITYIFPIGIIFNWPAKAMLGQLAWWQYLLVAFFALVWLFLGTVSWNSSVKRYTSASS